ncbi:hypothetical protein ACA910_021201 [Epithemia clementina (nom. ined.)]
MTTTTTTTNNTNNKTKTPPSPLANSNSNSNSQSNLPTGWKAVLDSNSGKTYYYHLQTRKTTWKRPTTTSNSPATTTKTTSTAATTPANTTTTTTTAGTASSSVGTATNSDQNQNKNSTTTTTTTSQEPPPPLLLVTSQRTTTTTTKPPPWQSLTQQQPQPQPPPRVESPPPVVRQQPPPPSPQASATTTVRPQTLEPTSTTSGSHTKDGNAAAAVTSSSSSLLLPGWNAVVDPTTNKTYYYHMQTRQTTWKRPSAAAEEEEGGVVQQQQQQQQQLQQQFQQQHYFQQQQPKPLLTTTATAATTPHHHPRPAWLQPRAEDQDSTTTKSSGGSLSSSTSGWWFFPRGPTTTTMSGTNNNHKPSPSILQIQQQQQATNPVHAPQPQPSSNTSWIPGNRPNLHASLNSNQRPAWLQPQPQPPAAAGAADSDSLTTTSGSRHKPSTVTTTSSSSSWTSWLFGGGGGSSSKKRHDESSIPLPVVKIKDKKITTATAGRGGVAPYVSEPPLQDTGLDHDVLHERHVDEPYEESTPTTTHTHNHSNSNSNSSNTLINPYNHHARTGGVVTASSTSAAKSSTSPFCITDEEEEYGIAAAQEQQQQSSSLQEQDNQQKENHHDHRDDDPPEEDYAEWKKMPTQTSGGAAGRDALTSFFAALNAQKRRRQRRDQAIPQTEPEYYHHDHANYYYHENNDDHDHDTDTTTHKDETMPRSGLKPYHASWWWSHFLALFDDVHPYYTTNTTNTTQRKTQQIWLSIGMAVLSILLIVYPVLLVAHTRRHPRTSGRHHHHPRPKAPRPKHDAAYYKDVDWAAEPFTVATLQVPPPSSSSTTSTVGNTLGLVDCDGDMPDGADLALLTWPNTDNNNNNNNNKDNNNNNNNGDDNNGWQDVAFHYSAPDSLCFLGFTSQDPSQESTPVWIPVARSYHGQPWEWYANSMGQIQPPPPQQQPSSSSSSSQRPRMQCDDQSKVCRIPLNVNYLLLGGQTTINNNNNNPIMPMYETIPNDDSKNNNNNNNNKAPSQPLALALGRRRVEPPKNPKFRLEHEYARFLEQTTFGTTRSSLKELLDRHYDVGMEQGNMNHVAISTVQIMAEWLKDQMNRHVTLPTYHREIWRRHAVPRLAEASYHATGRGTRPCDAQTAYRRFALTELHSFRVLHIEAATGKASKKRGTSSSLYVLRINDVVVTVLPNTGPIVPDNNSTLVFDYGSYLICRPPQPFVGGDIWLFHPDARDQDLSTCQGPIRFGSLAGNPPVQFDAVDPRLNANLLPEHWLKLGDSDVDVLDVEYYDTKASQTQRIVTNKALSGSLCSQLQSNVGDSVPVVFALFQSQYWIHDPRLVMEENTMENPLDDGGGTLVDQTIGVKHSAPALCANAPRTWLNEASCQLSQHPQVCDRSLTDKDEEPLLVTLNATTLQLFYSLTSSDQGGAGAARYIYAVQGLRLEEDDEAPPPCRPTARSRWMAVATNTTESDCLVNSQLQNQTLRTLSRLLTYNWDGTDRLRDILLKVPVRSRVGVCDDKDVEAKGFRVFAAGTCWQQVHPDEWQVFDFSDWLALHPGGADKLTQFATKGSPILNFPESHDMERWPIYRELFSDIQRINETVRFQQLPRELQYSPAVIAHFFPNHTRMGNSPNGNYSSVVCGSPGEVANDLTKGGDRFRGAFIVDDGESKFTHPKEQQVTWTTTAVTALDQLRQRVAWVLYQLLPVNYDGLNKDTPTEAFGNYYDIFVRNAFGSYRDVLKEVAYSPVMGLMLTYMDSKSTGYRWLQKVGTLEYPNENFARDIMQLFTIGLHELNQDGTPVLDSNQLPIPAFSNNDVEEYSRVWTGFVRQNDRGNIDDALDNRIDPMKIYVPYRDVFPKMGLNQQYIGDGYPLCADLPKRHFLKKGTKYVLLGSSPMPELQPDNDWNEAAVRFQADPLGQLGSALCGATKSRSCSYPAVVTLPETFACKGKECEVDTIRVVQIQGGIYYEYVPPPCVYQTFVENPRKIKRWSGGSGEDSGAYMCADPRTAVASTACCFNGGEANMYEKYWGERVVASTAEARCPEQSDFDDSELSGLCRAPGKLTIGNCVGNSCGGPIDPFFWFDSEAPCQIKAKIDTSNGKIAVVHSVPDEDVSQSQQRRLVNDDNPTFFRVQYVSEDMSINCSTNPECSATEDGYCLCNVTVTNELVFDGPPSSKDEVLSSLFIGAFSPELLDTSYYTVNYGHVKVHYPKQGSAYTTETIFEVEDDFGVTRLRKNVRSTVHIVGTSVTLRNPVQFLSLAEPTLRDAQYETDAALEHYFYHKNTAPFIAVRMAQRFGFSNPSPNYVQRIGNAFRTGTYVYQNFGFTTLFGKGLYGDLAATVAAVLLDPEARSVVLDDDPATGSLKEPLLKVTGVMRALEFKPTPEFPLFEFRANIQNAIGQMVYDAPDTFSFFPPESQPNGLLANAGLVSPESHVLSAPTIIRSMNGLLTMIKYGMGRCFGGLGWSVLYGSKDDCQSITPGRYLDSSGFPDFTPASNDPVAMVDELATLLTSGRLNAKLREVIANVVAKASDPLQAAIQAQQLVVSSSEFHSTGTVSKRGEPRAERNKAPQTQKPYKAVVVLMLNGGCDTYNLIVPHTCSGTNDAGMTILQQYTAERGSIALKKSERKLAIEVEGQPCEKFAIHRYMSTLQRLYNDGDLTLFLNAGVINKPVTKETYETVTPARLFAHNIMQKETQQVDPFNEVARTGILGRLSQILSNEAYGYNAQGISFNYVSAAVSVDGPNATAPTVLGTFGRPEFNEKPTGEAFDPQKYIESLNGVNHVSSNLFGELWSNAFVSALKENDLLVDALEDAEESNLDCGFYRTQELLTVLQMIKARSARGSDRDMFFVPVDGWDHHSNLKSNLNEQFKILNTALRCFVENLKDMGLWDSVTVLVMSEFGRTLTPNTNGGSDHGWAGHYFAMGGSLNGGKAFGQYPSDLTEKGSLNLGRGRMIPTLSWESIWMPVCEWMGVTTQDCSEYVLPNSLRTGSTLLSIDDVFKAI